MGPCHGREEGNRYEQERAGKPNADQPEANRPLRQVERQKRGDVQPGSLRACLDVSMSVGSAGSRSRSNKWNRGLQQPYEDGAARAYRRTLDWLLRQVCIKSRQKVDGRELAGSRTRCCVAVVWLLLLRGLVVKIVCLARWLYLGQGGAVCGCMYLSLEWVTQGWGIRGNKGCRTGELGRWGGDAKGEL